MLLHFELKDKIEAQYTDRLAVPLPLSQNALTARFVNGLAIELRYLNADEYSAQWLWRGALLRIDTAPTHLGLATFPNHFHAADGMVKADPLTEPGQAPWVNVRRLLDAILQDPLLGGATAALEQPCRHAQPVLRKS